MTSVLKWLQDRKGILVVAWVVVVTTFSFTFLRSKSLDLDRTSNGTVVEDDRDIDVSFYNIGPKVRHYLKLRIIVEIIILLCFILYFNI